MIINGYRVVISQLTEDAPNRPYTGRPTRSRYSSRISKKWRKRFGTHKVWSLKEVYFDKVNEVFYMNPDHHAILAAEIEKRKLIARSWERSINTLTRSRLYGGLM